MCINMLLFSAGWGRAFELHPLFLQRTLAVGAFGPSPRLVILVIRIIIIIVVICAGMNETTAEHDLHRETIINLNK